tara:strand:+ start:1140 stop:1505 length:366 start_codon:yes stop_codon:yes gene_type:complete
MEQLKLEDIVGYLPYGLKVKVGLTWIAIMTTSTTSEYLVSIDYVVVTKAYKPLLLPMTKEVLEEVFKEVFYPVSNVLNIKGIIDKDIDDLPKWIIDLFHEKHIDYMDLIGRGLALDKTKIK